jgi:hypothetical protein
MVDIHTSSAIRVRRVVFPIDISLALHSRGSADAYADLFVDATSLHPGFFADMEDGREVVRVDGILNGSISPATPGAYLHYPPVGSC